MPTADYALTMARYNLWQNENLINAANTLSQSDRQKERGAFFGSMEKTFSHLYWADQIWLSRFAGTPAPSGGIPGSLGLIKEWDAFVLHRAAFDKQILVWARNLSADWFAGDLVWYSVAAGREMKNRKTILTMHFFNHQTHHRGQIHAMLMAAGAIPGATDLAFMPHQYLNL